MTTTSLRARLAITFGITSVVLAAVVVAVSLSMFGLFNSRHRLLGQVEPAAISSEDLLAAYINQETGLRGYLLSGNTDFLQPYDQGEEEASSASAALARELAGDPRLFGLVHVAEQAGTLWQQQIVAPGVAARANGDLSFAAPAELNRSKQLFDAVRSDFGTLQAALSTETGVATRRLDRSTQQVIEVLLIALVFLLALGFAIWRALRTWVTDPLLRVGADARQVSEGDFDHPVAPTGPPELNRLVADIEAMRRRVLDELELVAAGRAELATLNDELARSNADLEQFAYVASHDLQEPLRKIASFCQLLQQRYGGQLDERADTYIDFAVDGAKRMQTLINDLLAFSRVGRTTEGFVTVELASCAATAIRNLAGAIEETNAQVVVDNLPTIQGDPVLLTTLLQNLIGNAVKFHADDPPVVHLNAERRDDEWLCSITDNGIGIEERFAERVFVIFQRLHSRERYEGTGIGLALCNKIVQFHGGRIWLDTTLYPGTRLFFTFPDPRIPR